MVSASSDLSSLFCYMGLESSVMSTPLQTTDRSFCRAQVVAKDFFNVVTVSFRVLYVFAILEIGTRKILHFNVTAHPTAEWTPVSGGDSVRAR